MCLQRKDICMVVMMVVMVVLLIVFVVLMLVQELMISMTMTRVMTIVVNVTVMVFTKLAQRCQSFKSLLQNQTWFELHTVQMHLIGLHTFEITQPSSSISAFESF